MLRWFVWSVLGILVLLAGAVALIETPWGHERIRRILVSESARFLNGHLEVGSLSGSLFTGTTLHNVRLVQEGRSLLSANDIRLRYSIWGFVHGSIDIEEVVLDRPVLAVVETTQGWNVTRILAPSGNSSQGRGRAVRLGRILINKGEVLLAPLQQRARNLSSLDFDGSLSVGNGHLTLTSRHFAARDPGTGVEVRELAARATLDPETLTIDGLNLQTGATHITGHARLTDRTRRSSLDAELAADPVSLPELSPYVPALKSIALVLDARVTARGPLDQLQAGWAVRSSAGTVNGNGVFDLANDVRTAKGDVNLASFDLSAFTGRPDLKTLLTGNVGVDAQMSATDSNAYTIAFRADAPDVMFRTYRARAVHAEGVYRPDGLNARGRGEAYGAAATFDVNWQSRSGLFVASGHAQHVDLRHLPTEFGAPKLATNVNTDYRVAFDAHGWAAEGLLSDSTVEGAEFSTGTTARIESRAGAVTYATEGHVASLDLDRLLQAVNQSAPHPRLRGNVDAGFRLEGHGTWEAPADHDATATLELKRSTLGPISIEGLNVQASLNERELTADISGRAQGEPLNVGQATPPTYLNGGVTAHVIWHDITAPITPMAMDGSLTLNLDNSTVSGLAIDRASIDGTVQKGLASIASLDVEGPAFRVSADGMAALGDQGASALNYTIDALDLKALTALVSQNISGGVHLEGRLEGSHALTKISGRLSAHELKRDTLDILAMDGDYAVDVPDLTPARATATSNILATFAQIGGFKIDRLTAKLKYDAETVDVVAKIEQPKRTFTAEAALLLAPDQQEARLRQFAMDTQGTIWQLEGEAATVRYGTDISISGLTLSSGASRITVDGAVPLKADSGRTGTLTTTLSAVRLADLDTLLLGTQKLKGEIDGTATLSGSLEKPAVNADISITAGLAGNVPFQSLSLKTEFADRVAKVDARLQVDAATALTLAGTMPVDGPGLDLRAHTDGIKLALFEPLTADHLERLAGVLTLDLAITGEVRAPSVRGDVGITGGHFRLTPTGEDYRALNALVRFDGDRVQVDHFYIEDDDGHALTASGNSAGGGLERSLNIDVKSSGIHVLNNKLGELALGTDLHTTGNMLAPHLSGSITIERGRLEVDKLLARFSSNAYEPVQEKTREAGVAPGEPPAQPEKPGRFSEATMDVELRVPDNLVLRGRDLRTAARSAGLGDLNVTAGGTVRVQKAPGAATTLLGEVAIVRGNYTFQSRRFEIERGSAVRFLGGDTLDPTLAIGATRDISGVTARVGITGTLSRPRIELSSTPPLDPGDVLSLIVFNQPINELGEGEQVSLAERAGQLAASAIATPISDSVAHALDLDVFEIQSGEAGGSGPTITVGRQVSDRLFVGFRHEFGSDEASRVSFEYQLRRFLRIVTSFGQGSNPNRIPREETAGLDLFFVIKR